MRNPTSSTPAPMFGANVAKHYAQHLVPVLFEPWGRALLEGLELRRGASLLDVATGPATLVPLAAPKLGPDGRIVGTDLSADMLAVGRAVKLSQGSPKVELLEAPAAPLPVQDGTFDFVVCQQGLQFFPDKPAAVREMKRAMKKGGRLGISVWCPIEQNPWFLAQKEALVATAGHSGPLEVMQKPFSFGEKAPLEALLRDAGFSDIRVEVKTLPLVFEGGVEQAQRARMGAPWAPGIEALPPDVRSAYEQQVRTRMEKMQQQGVIRTQMKSLVAYARG